MFMVEPFANGINLIYYKYKDSTYVHYNVKVTLRVMEKKTYKDCQSQLSSAR